MNLVKYKKIIISPPIIIRNIMKAVIELLIKYIFIDDIIERINNNVPIINGWIFLLYAGKILIIRLIIVILNRITEEVKNRCFT